MAIKAVNSRVKAQGKLVTSDAESCGGNFEHVNYGLGSIKELDHWTPGITPLLAL